MNKTFFVGVAGGLLSTVLAVSPVFAHSVVRPNQVGVAAFQDFSLGVPSEKDATTTSVKLLLPPGLNFVSPVVKSGWKVEVKSGPIPAGMQAPVAADGDVATTIPTEIDWTGGAIPAGQKDIFVFSAQVPAQAGDLNWKVYQGYSDGSTVSWDQAPTATQPKNDKGAPDFSKVGPYSTTSVVNDLKPGTSTSSTPNSTTIVQEANPKKILLALGLSIISLLASGVALAMQFMKKSA